jgi:hypothetical protein
LEMEGRGEGGFGFDFDFGVKDFRGGRRGEGVHAMGEEEEGCA